MGQVNFKTQDEIAAERLANWRASAKVSRFQAFQALDDFGLLAQVEEWAKTKAGKEKRAFEMAQEFKYDSPTLQAACDALGIVAEQKDELFKHAEGIDA